jgi:DNA-directed RNA polymerase specialized sigma24 family protein
MGKGGRFVLLEATTSFERFCNDMQPRLRQAFAARYGHADGADATAESLAYAWENWETVRQAENPAGLLYRVGQSRTRRIRRATPLLFDASTVELPDVEPALPAALASLSANQRVTVTLVVGFGWTMREVADLLAVSVSTVQNHRERGMKKLRAKIGDAS